MRSHYDRPKEEEDYEQRKFREGRGVCAVLSAVALIAAVVCYGIAGVEEDVDKIDAFLRDAEGNAAYTGAMWSWVVAGAFLIPAAFGFYQALCAAGGLLRLAVAFVAVGATVLFVVMAGALGWVGQLAPGYVEAGEAVRPALEVVARTLMETLIWGHNLAVFFSLGIGGLLFSIGVLRTSVIPGWIGWLGVVAGVASLSWLGIGVADVFAVIATVGLVVALVWLLAMGVALLRLRKPAAPATEA